MKKRNKIGEAIESAREFWWALDAMTEVFASKNEQVIRALLLNLKAYQHVLKVLKTK